MPNAAPAAGAGQMRRQLFEDRTGPRVVRAWVMADGSSCGLECQVLARGWPEASAEELAGLLRTAGVVRGVDPAALEALAAEIRDGRAVAGRVVARWKAPEPGRDGVLEFIVKPSGEHAEFRSTGPDGRIDYRETHLVQNILAGEPAAIEIPPRSGQDGVDVFGRTVSAPQGQPAKYRLGQNVRFDESNRQVIALIDGRVVWEDGCLSVSRLLRVRGSVDYSIGNIAFIGDVAIDGDVLDGFNVHAGGNLVVGGNVGACELDAEGDLVVRGGVFGKGRAKLRSKGTLSARFLNDCRAECAGQMTVEREIVGSDVLTNRSLTMTHGRLAGGSVSALAGVDVAVLGSPMGVQTTVAAGTDFTLSRRQAEVERRAAEVDASVEKISGFLGPLLTDRRRMAELVRRRREDLQRLVGALRNLRQERAELAKQLEELAEASHRGALRQVNVRREMHPGVLLELGQVRHRVKTSATGPMSIVEDRASGTLRTREFRELPGPIAG